MRVFVSWSGEPSRSVARALDGWLESVVQHVDAWMSDDEISSGARWNDVIAKALGETNFGIICVTRANQAAPWLIFEAGALATSVETARVVPLCIDLKPSEVTGPLAAFQARSLDKDGLRRLVHDLSAAEKPMPKDRLDELFDAMWLTLESPLKEAISSTPTDQAPTRPPEDMLSELVETVRRLERDLHDSRSQEQNLVAADPPIVRGRRGSGPKAVDAGSTHHDH